MSLWSDRVLREFTSDLHRVWIVSDPDGVLLDEHILATLRERGFEVLPFEDPIVFRAEYEERYRSAWDANPTMNRPSLVVHLRDLEPNSLPWDILRQGEHISLSLADLFSKLSYSVLRQLGNSFHEQLYEAQEKHASQVMGENATKEFILTHIYRINPHLISNPVELWRELTRLLNRDELLPKLLAEHVARVLCGVDEFTTLPLCDLFTSKPTLLHFVQREWESYIRRQCQLDADVPELQGAGIPFEHPDIRSSIESMLLNGVLRPIAVERPRPGIPKWIELGLLNDPSKQQERVRSNISQLQDELPSPDASHREWFHAASKFAEMLAHYHLLDPSIANSFHDDVKQIATLLDSRLLDWLSRHYADLPSLPAIKSPAMVHHIPRYLSAQMAAGRNKQALLVFDGMALDQWAIVREVVGQQNSKISFDDTASFAWLPSLTSVSRQALFSGLKPREFSSSITTTSQEQNHWTRFWLNQGLKQHEVYFRKKLRRSEQLNSLEADLANDSINVVGLVIDTIDDFVHGAVLGKRGIAVQVRDWCDTGFISDLLSLLAAKGFQIYVTADHGNIDSRGEGRPAEGVASEHRGERVRIYNKELLADQLVSSYQDAFRINLPALPPDYFPVFAGGNLAFVQTGEPVVAHGGVSLQEAIVPFSRVFVLG